MTEFTGSVGCPQGAQGSLCSATPPREIPTLTGGGGDRLRGSVIDGELSLRARHSTEGVEFCKARI
jgi:hypothetical protein